MSNCPHGNRNCTPVTLCTPCNGGGVLRDGEGITVPMVLCDSMHEAARRALNESRVTDSVRSQAAADHEAWKRDGQPIQHDGLSDYEAAALASNARNNAATLEQARRNTATQQAVRDHHGNASERAYADECARLQRGGRD